MFIVEHIQTTQKKTVWRTYTGLKRLFEATTLRTNLRWIRFFYIQNLSKNIKNLSLISYFH